MTGGQAEHETPLWTFSLAVYGRDGVPEECLDAQDRCGVNVNVLLMCAYAGAAAGAVLSDTDLGEAIAATERWQGEAVRGLRQVRRTLKPWGSGEGAFAPAIEALRTRVKAIELEAERI